MKTILRKIFPHIAVILGGMYVVFYCIDRVNPAMAFVNNEITKGILLAFCIVGMINACVIIGDDRRRARRRARRKKASKRTK